MAAALWIKRSKAVSQLLKKEAALSDFEKAAEQFATLSEKASELAKELRRIARKRERMKPLMREHKSQT